MNQPGKHSGNHSEQGLANLHDFVGSPETVHHAGDVDCLYIPSVHATVYSDAYALHSKLDPPVVRGS